jgi:hypothetical protein
MSGKLHFIFRLQPGRQAGKLIQPWRLEIAATQTKPTSVGWKAKMFVLVRAGGLCLCSSELYSPLPV